MNDHDGPIKQIPLDDWTEQDLLTRSEATERLAKEIETTRTALVELGTDGDLAERAALLRRLDVMSRVRADLGR